MQVLDDAGYDHLESTTDRRGVATASAASPARSTTSLANAAAVAMVTGADIWDINANESVAYQYSRYNYNVTDFFTATDAVRGLRPQPGDRRARRRRRSAPRTIQILGTNDFHGRHRQRPAPTARCRGAGRCGQAAARGRTPTRCSPPPVT